MIPKKHIRCHSAVSSNFKHKGDPGEAQEKLKRWYLLCVYRCPRLVLLRPQPQLDTDNEVCYSGVGGFGRFARVDLMFQNAVCFALPVCFALARRDGDGIS